MSRPFIEIEQLAQQFPDNAGGTLTVFQDINLTLEKGEFVTIIGHSGCGKSTILNVLAGLAEPSAGTVIMGGKEVAGPSLERGVVFQNYSLLPWLSALSNVMFGVRARWPSWSKEKIRTHSAHFLELVGLGGALDKKPAELSGGMRQRVSIARAFATQPQLLLLDEPFGALDALTRGVIQEELLNIWADTKQTVFMITHDVDEAILLSDRILLMSNGPEARIAESVRVDIDRPRVRADIVNHPDYYALRNHLVDFLVNRAGDSVPDSQRAPREVTTDTMKPIDPPAAASASADPGQTATAW